MAKSRDAGRKQKHSKKKDKPLAVKVKREGLGLNQIAIEVAGHTLIMRKAGMTEFYKQSDMLDESSHGKRALELQGRLDKLEALGDDITEKHRGELNEVTEELRELNIGADASLREFVMARAVAIERGNDSGGAEDAALFIDTLGSDYVVHILILLQPDLEKNSQSQS